jgi:hypothetical protein
LQPYTPISIHQAAAPVTVTETSDSGFNRGDALIGAMIACRQGGLGYR